MSMPSKAVDRLFDRLTATYGRHFTDLYAGIDPAAVKAAWATELAFNDAEAGMKAIAWALDHLPERAPNAVQFKMLVRQAPWKGDALALTDDRKAIPMPAEIREKINSILGKK